MFRENLTLAALNRRIFYNIYTIFIGILFALSFAGDEITQLVSIEFRGGKEHTHGDTKGHSTDFRLLIDRS